MAAGKSMPGLGGVQRITVPEECARSTQAHLRAAGRGGNEGLVVWSGIQDGAAFFVRTVTVPAQRPIRSAAGVCVVLEGNALHELNVWLRRNGERLVAQVHSHPTNAYHSDMDDDFAIVTAVGSLSLVVPDFAVRSFSVADCAVYRLTRGGRWAEVPPRKAAELVSVIPV
jgi:hypothetical protein